MLSLTMVLIIIIEVMITLYIINLFSKPRQTICPLYIKLVRALFINNSESQSTCTLFTQPRPPPTVCPLSTKSWCILIKL